MPDTQQEVLRSSDTRFINRTKWLVNQKSALDLRFATQSGDLVNWDTPEHDQYEVASAGMKPLEAADIPYTIAIGNHDTMATGVGGGARDATMTRIYQRDTRTFNSYFNASRYTKVGGAFETGKVDNIYSLYEAGGVKWMVLVLELWPRKAAVEWAKGAVASHPDHNVIMVTHDYLDGAGGLEQIGRLRRHQPPVPLRQPDQPVPEHQDDVLRPRRLRHGQGLHRQEREQDLLVPDHDPFHDDQPGAVVHRGHQGRDPQDLDLRALHQRDLRRRTPRRSPESTSSNKSWTALNAGGARGLSDRGRFVVGDRGDGPAGTRVCWHSLG